MHKIKLSSLITTDRGMRKSLHQTGDTIVEVLICMAVISMVLGGAFLTTRTSQLAVRDSQEHSEALKLIESQLEQLRAAASNGGAGSGIFVDTPFCMFQGSSQKTTSKDGSGKFYCMQDSSGNTSNAANAFQLTIQCQTTPAPNTCDGSTGFLYQIQATWPEVNGTGTASESMYYRLYE